MPGKRKYTKSPRTPDRSKRMRGVTRPTGTRGRAAGYTNRQMEERSNKKMRKGYQYGVPYFDWTQAAGSVFPDKVNTKLVWSVTYGSGATPGNVFNSHYDLNYPIDPINALGGDQPTGYDQMETQYKEVCVYGVKAQLQLTAEAMNGCGEVQHRAGVYMIAYPNTGGVRSVTTYGPSDQPALDRSSRVRFLPFHPEQGSSNTQVLSTYIDIGALYGKTRKEVLNDENFWQRLVSGGSLTNHAILTIFGTSGSSAGITLPKLGWTLKLVMYCQYRGRKPLPLSV